MFLSQKIISARKLKGFTQEELADLAKVTVRTIQRIESGETIPRNYTAKAIARALDIPFEQLINETGNGNLPVAGHASMNDEDARHFLQLLCLSAFSYIVIPYIHFLIPSYLLRKKRTQHPQVVRFARRFIRGQIIWVITTHLLFLIVVAYNLLQASYFGKRFPVHFLWPVLIMYFLNAIIILINLKKIRQLEFVSTKAQIADAQ